MRRVARIWSAAVVAVVGIVLVGCERPAGESAGGRQSGSTADAPRPARAPASVPTSVPVVVNDIGPGTLDGTAYRHEKLGLKIDFPEGWYVELGKLDASNPRTQVLVQAAERPPGSPGLFNRSVVVTASTVAQLPAPMGPAAYLEMLRVNLPLTGVAYDFDRTSPAVTLGGREFAALQGRMHMGQARAHQRYLARRVGDNIVTICTSCENRGGFDQLAELFLNKLEIAEK